MIENGRFKVLGWKWRNFGPVHPNSQIDYCGGKTEERDVIYDALSFRGKKGGI